mgnify:CR=1 FL=1
MSQDDKKCPYSHLTTDFGAPVVDNQNSMTAGARGPLLAQDLWLNEKLANFVREVIPERRMHAKGSGAFGTFTVTHDITQYTRAKIFSEIGKKTEMFARFTTVAGERGAAVGLGLVQLLVGDGDEVHRDERDEHDRRGFDAGEQGAAPSAQP